MKTSPLIEISLFKSKIDTGIINAEQLIKPRSRKKAISIRFGPDELPQARAALEIKTSGNR